MKLSLRYKAALFIALTEFALLGLLVLTNLYQTRSDLEEQLRQRAHATAELVAASATEPVLSSDLAQIRNLLAGVVHKHQVRYAAVTDHRERLLAEAGQRAEPASVVEVAHPISVADTLFGRVTLQVARAETEAALAKTTRSNLIIAGLAMGLVAFISLTLGWFLTRNLAALARGVEAVRQGDYAARVGLRSRDEVGDLAAGFNDMATQLEQTVSDLARSQQRFRDLADNTSDWLWETDAEGRYTYVSKSVEFLLGYAPQDLLGRRIFELMTAEDAVRLEQLFQLAREGRQPFYGFEYHATGRGGASVVLEANGIPLLDDIGMLLGYRGISRDITRRKVDESRIVYLAEHDPLTGLLSRQKFLEALDDELKLVAYSERPFAVLFIDLDDFKLINDTHGHRVGDTLLRAAADLLARLAGEGNSLARLGGDEFGLLLRGGGTVEAQRLAQQLLGAVESAALTAGGRPVRLTASIGISGYPDSGRTSETLLAHADIAMSRAKSHGHNRWHAYLPSDTDLDSMRRTVDWQAIIQHALETDGFFLDFQPIVRVSGENGPAYFEALVRLRDTGDQTHTAERFIETAEHTGQIVEIDKWVLRRVVATLAQPEHRLAHVAMNLSGRTLGTPGLLDYFRQQLRASGVEPARIVFEVTETAAVAEMARAESFLAHMKQLGYRFSLDDFGAGFSSFTYLKHMPVDQVKIDGSFIRYLDTNRADQIFVRAIVQVTKELGLETVAECVETPGTLALLLDMGVDYVQGYHIGQPGPDLVTPKLKRPGRGDWKVIGRAAP